MSSPACAYCREAIPAGARRDSVYCGQRCRQAAHRFKRDSSHRDPGDGSPAAPMRFAYADPPYPGLAFYYEGHPDYAGEVDHAALLAELEEPGRYDGWALSTSSRSLSYVLGLCAAAGADVRVAAWFRGPRGRARARRPVQAWEPVVYRGGRELGPVRPDALVHIAKPRTTDPDRVIGAKPAAFARWLFELLGAAAGDELVDLFPGSGGILRAWNIYTSAPANRDASRSTSADASPLPRGDASCEYSGDASLRTSPDASDRSPSDASRRAAPDAIPFVSYRTDDLVDAVNGVEWWTR